MATVSDDGWRRPSGCSTNSCIEVRRADEVLGVLELRSSSIPGRVAYITPEEFAAFVAAVKAGEYDDLATP